MNQNSHKRTGCLGAVQRLQEREREREKKESRITLAAGFASLLSSSDELSLLLLLLSSFLAAGFAVGCTAN
jgi:hypothetical protein